MAKDRDRRYQTPEQLVRDLLILAGTLGLRSVSPEGLIWMSAARMPTWERHLVWAIPALVFAMVLTTLAWWGQDLGAPSPATTSVVPPKFIQDPLSKPAETGRDSQSAAVAEPVAPDQVRTLRARRGRAPRHRGQFRRRPPRGIELGTSEVDHRARRRWALYLGWCVLRPARSRASRPARPDHQGRRRASARPPARARRVRGARRPPPSSTFSAAMSPWKAWSLSSTRVNARTWPRSEPRIPS